MMIKNADQLLVAAEVMKIAKELQLAQLQADMGAAPNRQLNEAAWFVENSLPMFAKQAYRNLTAFSAHLDAIVGEDSAAASMMAIDGMLERSATVQK